ncbi:MAG: hypothetical protein KME49_25990 [Brasilonema octagenarum HA4186-MV1]|jgi:uncharacterized protein (DUF362 family)|uniref:Uncharacterized protein n=1 Tax=Brasilonema octagenarum UFV-OR1 TaxID=417115 RepID=A0ABX1MIJ1_9CYAN|nr:hypothetical protein [Brasilonema octagenarum]MBW4628868.1 hypothetical protein [Brasilonema octagenarum HA4186-MV1]NMF66900.1 hypothetical protein [Brasilonema octagenarum UFV-OR1]
MNYQKLDSALAVALNDVNNSQEHGLKVFIHTENQARSTDTTTVLENLGVADVTPEKDVFTATLSPNAISQLSEQPWVQYIKLSQNLRLFNRK